MTKKSITVRIEEDQFVRLKEYCALKKISMSDYIRKLLDEFLPQEMKIKRLPDNWVFRDFGNDE